MSDESVARPAVNNAARRPPRRGTVWAVRLVAAVGALALLAVCVVAGVRAYSDSRLLVADAVFAVAAPSEIEVDLTEPGQLIIQSDDYISEPTIEQYGHTVDGVEAMSITESPEGTLRLTSRPQPSLPFEEGPQVRVSVVLRLPTELAERVDISVTAGHDSTVEVYSPAQRLDYTGESPYLYVDGAIQEMSIDAPNTEVSLNGPIHDADVDAGSLFVDFHDTVPEQMRVLVHEQFIVAGLPGDEELALAANDGVRDWFASQRIQLADPDASPTQLTIAPEVTADMLWWEPSDGESGW